MEWTKDEICRNYENSKNKKNQIAVLAQLNDCSKEEIKRILRDGGCLESVIDQGEKSAAVPVPEIIITTLREKQMHLLEMLDETEEQMTSLQRQQEELTLRYKEISDYLAIIV